MAAPLRIGCPACETPVTATVPDGPGLQSTDDVSTEPLRGQGVPCRNCGHELELYFY